MEKLDLYISMISRVCNRIGYADRKREDVGGWGGLGEGASAEGTF